MRRTVFRIQVMRLPRRALTALSARLARTGRDEPDESGNYERGHDPKGSHYREVVGQFGRLLFVIARSEATKQFQRDMRLPRTFQVLAMTRKVTTRCYSHIIRCHPCISASAFLSRIESSAGHHFSKIKGFPLYAVAMDSGFKQVLEAHLLLEVSMLIVDSRDGVGLQAGAGRGWVLTKNLFMSIIHRITMQRYIRYSLCFLLSLHCCSLDKRTSSVVITSGQRLGAATFDGEVLTRSPFGFIIHRITIY
jgi:hypothetical protein